MLEGLIELRQHRTADGQPPRTGWRTVFAALQSDGELVFKPFILRPSRSRETVRDTAAPNDASRATSASVPTLAAPNGAAADSAVPRFGTMPRKQLRPMSMVAEPASRAQTLRPGGKRPAVLSTGSVPPPVPRSPKPMVTVRPEPGQRHVTHLRRSLSEGMLSTSTDVTFARPAKGLRKRAHSFSKLTIETPAPAGASASSPRRSDESGRTSLDEDGPKPRTLTVSVGNNSALSMPSPRSPSGHGSAEELAMLGPLRLTDARVLWLLELIDQPDVQALLQEEEEQALPRTTLYCIGKAWGVVLIRADTPTLAATWCRELRRASRGAVAEATVPAAGLPQIQITVAPERPSACAPLPGPKPAKPEVPPAAAKPKLAVDQAPGKGAAAAGGLGTVRRGTITPEEALLLARRSHCIPHSFVTENYLLRLVKCNFCRKTIHEFRGSRCIHCSMHYHKDCAAREAPNCGMAQLQQALDDATQPAALPAKSPGGTLSSGSSSGILRAGKTATVSPAAVPLDTMKRKMKTIGGDVFGIPLAELVLADNGLPTILVMCVHTIERRGMTSEGIYRLSGSKKDLERLRMYFAFGRPNLDDEARWSDINVITGVFKAWLRELPEPLMTFELDGEYTALVDFNRTPAVDLVQLVATLNKLPSLNYRILQYLCDHLKRVAGHSKDNKMMPGNLAKVFGPTLFRSRDETSMNRIGERVTLVETMIEQHDEIFGAVQ